MGKKMHLMRTRLSKEGLTACKNVVSLIVDVIYVRIHEKRLYFWEYINILHYFSSVKYGFRFEMVFPAERKDNLIEFWYVKTRKQ